MIRERAPAGEAAILRLVADGSDGVVLWRCDSADPAAAIFLWANAAAAAASGIDMAALYGLPMRVAFPPLADSGLAASIVASARESASSDHVMPYGDNDIARGWFDVKVRPAGPGVAAVLYHRLDPGEITAAQDAAARQQHDAAGRLAEIGARMRALLEG